MLAMLSENQPLMHVVTTLFFSSKNLFTFILFLMYSQNKNTIAIKFTF